MQSKSYKRKHEAAHKKFCKISAVLTPSQYMAFSYSMWTGATLVAQGFDKDGWEHICAAIKGFDNHRIFNLGFVDKFIYLVMVSPSEAIEVTRCNTEF